MNSKMRSDMLDEYRRSAARRAEFLTARRAEWTTHKIAKERPWGRCWSSAFRLRRLTVADGLQPHCRSTVVYGTTLTNSSRHLNLRRLKPELQRVIPSRNIDTAARDCPLFSKGD